MHADCLPHLGISSVVHFAAFLLMFALMPDAGGFREAEMTSVTMAGAVVVPFQSPSPPPLAPPEDPPPIPEEAPSGIQDLPPAFEPGPPAGGLAHEFDIPQGDRLRTDDGEEAEDGPSGDPTQLLRNSEPAFQIGTFVPTSRILSPRGKAQGHGRNERAGFPGRLGGNRNATGIPVGMTEGSQDALKRALEWLKRHQAPDGRWEAGERAYDVGVTGLALLAYVGHGDTSGGEAYPDTVRRGLAWLKGQQGADGCIGPKDIEKHLYNHAIAALALAEAAAMGEYALKVPAQKAANYLLACQNPGGGWRYRDYNLPGAASEADGNNDTSVTGWAVMALKSARVAGLSVPPAAFEGASAWLDQAYQAGADYKGSFGYVRKGAFILKSPYATTSVGVLVRLLLGQNRGVQEGAATLLERLPAWGDGQANLYYWYYGSLALFQMGGEPWAAWNEAMLKALCGHQETQGDAEGSWDPAQDAWGKPGGRACTTALGALCLEVYYRYARDMKLRP